MLSLKSIIRGSHLSKEHGLVQCTTLQAVRVGFQKSWSLGDPFKYFRGKHACIAGKIARLSWSLILSWYLVKTGAPYYGFLHTNETA